ncbi:MAG: diversity-generating retroelement protein bAvd family protein [Candidatus Latescibacterota bacterium]|nr:MAG: diversity-generating retroelement protein bAvd family protein [Candidatus Latescibacterota bacterium]
MEYRGFRDLKVYQLAYKLAMEIFEETKNFPKEEKYSLTDQLRRSSRSIVANIAEAWKKRMYVKSFVSKLIDSYGEEGETEVWLDMAFDSGYLTEEKHRYFRQGYDEVSKMLHSMISHPEKFCT